MNKRIKARWIKALTLGKYEQRKGRLRGKRPDKESPNYCCLGVLCDLHSKSKNGRKWAANNYMKQEFSLPATVMKWAGLKSNAGIEFSPPLKIKNENIKSLIDANDDGDLTFPEIAELIDTYL